MDKKTKMKEKKASGIWKKVLGICLAVIMVIGMTMPAWAQIDAESKGSIKLRQMKADGQHRRTG